MATSFSAYTHRSKSDEHDYALLLDSMDLRVLVKEFLSYLDYTEETDSGREFHPITIGSCRILMSRPLDMCLKKLREKVGDTNMEQECCNGGPLTDECRGCKQ